jgi:plasmid replication initiation protein
MGNKLVVKTNRLIESLQTLSLAETRLLQLAIVNARENGKGLDSSVPLSISAVEYAKEFHVSNQAGYIALKSAEETLFERRFTIIDVDKNPIKSRWVQDVKYIQEEGRIEITLSRIVAKEITKIDGLKDFFTSYLLEKTSGLNSVYAIRLYELLIQWKTVKKTPVFEIDNFRNQLGLGVNEYKQMNNFKARVLDVAVEQINKNTDLTVKYEQHKKGVRINGFSFSFKFKEEKKQVEKGVKNPDLFSYLTPKQIHYFSREIAKAVVENRSPVFTSLSIFAPVGTGESEFAERIAQDLKNEHTAKRYYQALLELGFKP